MKSLGTLLRAGELSGPWLLGALTVLAGIITFFPTEVAMLDASLRTPVAVAIVVIAIYCGVCIFVQRRRRRTDDFRVADHLLSIAAGECISAGSWRVTLFQEVVREGGRVYLSRVRRLAQRPELSGGGTTQFALEESVLRGMMALELNDADTPPIDMRINLPDPYENETQWRKAQRGFVGDRAKHLRMRSRSYGWRRIRPSGPGQHLHVLLVETTHEHGIRRAGLENALLDSIAHALVASSR